MSQEINPVKAWKDLYFFESKLTAEILDRIIHWEENQKNVLHEFRCSETSVQSLHRQIKKLIQNH